MITKTLPLSDFAIWHLSKKRVSFGSCGTQDIEFLSRRLHDRFADRALRTATLRETATLGKAAWPKSLSKDPDLSTFISEVPELPTK